MTKKDKSQYNVRFNKNGKIINFSTHVSKVLEGYEDVDVFEKDCIIAVQPTIGGSYHISGEVGRPRKGLSNAQLVEYLCKKFGCVPGDSLPAWLGKQEDVLFFGGMQPNKEEIYTLDESYTAIEVEYNRRAGDWAYIHDNWTEFTREVREVLPRRLTAYRCGNAVLLMGDAAGKLVMTPKRQRGTPMLVSPALADYLREMFDGSEKGMRLRAKIVQGGVILADKIEALATADLTQCKPLDLNGCSRYFVTLGMRGALYLSAAAAQQLKNEGERLSLYRASKYLALKVNDGGALHIGEQKYAHYICSNHLCEMVRKWWPTEKKLYLLSHGKFWLMHSEPIWPADVPPASAFKVENPKERTAKQTKARPKEIAANKCGDVSGLWMPN